MKITNIRKGHGLRSKYIYACLEDDDGTLLIVAATLDYIVALLPEILAAKLDGGSNEPGTR